MTDVRSYPASDFPLERLLAHKHDLVVSVCIPARNEEATIGTIVEVIREHLTSPATPPDAGPARGKGDAPWKSVAACEGDLIVWIDADLTSFTPRCVTGLVGPLLIEPSIAMVKGYYERPEVGGTGGGRTTDLMARPLLATLFPHLTSVRQLLERPDLASVEAQVDERPPLARVAGYLDGRVAPRA